MSGGRKSHVHLQQVAAVVAVVLSVYQVRAGFVHPYPHHNRLPLVHMPAVQNACPRKVVWIIRAGR